MLVEIIRDKNNKPIGWSMTGENKEEINKLIDIRNMQFLGINDTAIRYAGRSGGNNKEFNPGTLSWKQSKYIKH